jgi:hypothetical protein
MTGQEQTHISLGDNFHGAIICGAGTTIELDTAGNVDIYTDGAVKLHPAIKPDTEPKNTIARNPQIGDIMPSGDPNAGWIYGGISRKTLLPFYVAPKDAGVFRWKAAMNFASRERARPPSREELNQLYEAQEAGALKGTFNVSGSIPVGYYWSATEYRDYENGAWSQRFKDGLRDWSHKASQLSLRLVRS